METEIKKEEVAEQQKLAEPETKKDVQTDKEMSDDKEKRIQELSAEAKKWRLKVREYEKTLEEQQKTTLIEQGKYKELYDQQINEVSKLREMIETISQEKENLSTKYQEYESIIAGIKKKETEKVKELLTKIPEAVKVGAGLDENSKIEILQWHLENVVNKLGNFYGASVMPPNNIPQNPAGQKLTAREEQLLLLMRAK